MDNATGLIGEHESRGEKVSGDKTYEPSPEDKATIKLAERVFEKNKLARSATDYKWPDFYNLFRGRQWKDARPSYRHSDVINFIFRVIQSCVPIQMDSRPKFEFLPREPQDFELAEIMNMAAEADWESKGWSEQELEVVYDANIIGTGMSGMDMDPDGNHKLGDIVYQSKDPFYCYPAPKARSVNNECPTFVYAEPKDVAWIKKKYPDVKDFIKPDLIDLMKTSKNETAPLRVRTQGNQNMLDTGIAPPNSLEKDQALLVTVWLTSEFCEDQYDEKEKQVQGADGEPPTTEYEQHAKYPNGRKIVICNGVLCSDGPNGYDDGETPLSRYPNYVDPRNFWGISEIEQLEGPQRMFNKVFNFAMDVLTLMGNPIWLVPTTSGVDPENLVNRPGLNVEYDGDTPPSRAEGVQLQPYVMQIAEKLEQWIDSEAGVQDVTKGVQPTGVTAMGAITALQEAAHTRIRQKARNLDIYLQTVGQQYASRVFQFRTAPQMYRLTNKDGSQKYFRMHVEHYDKTKEKMVQDPATGQTSVVQEPTGEQGTKMHYQPYEPNGQFDPTQAKVLELQGKLDVRVSTGSSLPFNKAEKEQKLLALFDRGIIDRIEVLKGSDYPNWEAVEQRMLEKEQAAAQAEAAAAQAPPAA